MSDDLVTGEDGLPRCRWGASTPDYVLYHDEEWGRPVHGADALYEKLCLEAFQSGLSWLTILRKRENFRRAFAGFEIASVARFGDDDVARLMADAGIVRNRAKIEAAIANARAAAAVDDLSALIWSHAPDPDGRPAPRTMADDPGDHRRVDRAGQGAQAARLPLRRPHHRLRADAGVRSRQRPPGGLLRPMSISFERLTAGPERSAHEWLAEVRPHERAPDDRPFLYLNMVASADGRATFAGRTEGLGSEADTRLLTELRALADAVLVGTGTVRAEGYGRMVRNAERIARRKAAGLAETPTAVLISRSFEIPWDAGLFAAEDQPVIVYTGGDGPEPDVAAPLEIVRLEDPTPRAVMADLRARGVRSLLCEGGTDAQQRAARGRASSTSCS